MARKILWGLIVITAGMFSAVFLGSQDYSLAVLAVVLGCIWFGLEARQRHEFGWLFFLIFVGMAVWGSAQNVSTPMLLLGLTADLGAWDLSRFQLRVRSVPDTPIRARLERKHIQKLLVTLGSGFFIALVPLYIQVSISFVAVALFVLFGLFALRRSVLVLLNREE